MPVDLQTIEALVAAANAAPHPAECERCLAAACAQAESFSHWKTILDGLPASVSVERRRQLLASSIESARTREEIWGFKNAAVAQARVLGDPGAARETLRDGERMLVTLGERGESLGFYWGVLAEGFKEALGDDAEVERALAAGWELAWGQRDVENLGRITNQWARLLDPRAAAERLARVEQAAREWGRLGGVIYWWHALGDAAAGRRVRQTTLETATRFEEALDLARYWTLYEKDSPGIGAAFAKAESLAVTAAEWFELARRARTVGDKDLSRRALDRAAVVTDGAEIRARIAHAYLDWFGDEAAAAAVGPPGVRPDDLRSVETRLDGWEGSASALFDWLRARVTREQLLEIAGADYGHDTEAHLAALEQIVASGLVPIELAWHPGEVVALTRWSAGEGVGHVERAFSCVLLCLNDREGELSNTAAPLVDSLMALGAEAMLLGEGLMVWKWRTTTDDDGDDRFVALLALCMLRAAADPKDPRLTGLLRRLAAPDARGLRQCLAGSLRADMWTTLLESMPSAHLAALGFTTRDCTLG